MFKIILIFMIVLIQFNFCFAYTDDSLDKLEAIKYGHVYSNEDLASRLRRLETDFFGMSQTGNIDNRINNLIRISDSLEYYGNYENYYEKKKKSKAKKFLDDFASILSVPAITGYTPSLMPYNAYSNSIYNNELRNMRNGNYCPAYPSYSQYSSRRYSNRYGRMPNSNYIPYQPTDIFSNFAAGSTVHMLP